MNEMTNFVRQTKNQIHPKKILKNPTQSCTNNNGNNKNHACHWL